MHSWFYAEKLRTVATRRKKKGGENKDEDDGTAKVQNPRRGSIICLPSLGCKGMGECDVLIGCQI